MQIINLSLRCLASVLAAMGPLAAVTATPSASPSASPHAAVHIAWHFSPDAHLSTTESVKHLISYDVSNTLRGLLGSRVNPVTIQEDRARTLTLDHAGTAYQETEINKRRYGGDHPKDTSVKERSVTNHGTIAPDGKRTPPIALYEDAGDAALAQLPGSDVAIGQTWTFTEQISTDRDLGQGPMVFTDKLERIDVRAGHQIAVISVAGSGRIDMAQDLQAKGFHTSTMTLTGTAEFDLTQGLPGVQHYVGHIGWNARVMFTHIGVNFDDTYDATPWTAVH